MRNTISEKISVNLAVSNISHVPQLRYNLLSVTSLIQKGCRLVSENNCVVIFDKYNKFITEAIKNEKRLEIELQPAFNSRCNFTDMTVSNYENWHSR